ncbi:MAG: hypothetical protein E5Y51_03815 [Mesorhizobium sp.]|nr:MAG: hypothetical protein E5Y51_03815 [Mesorhizobium sp.]
MSPPSFGSNIKNELLASLIWAKMGKGERKAFAKAHGTSLGAIVEHGAGSAEFDYTALTEQAGKKNFSEYLSRHLGSRFSVMLAPSFPGILPSPDGKGHESRARTSKGYKKLDVNYSTPELGLGLGVSIKTINAVDPSSKRYTKNFTRVDAELRAEAADYHERQPYATMVAVIFLPFAACDDASDRDPSSFGAAVQLFRNRAGRDEPADSHMLFEGVFVGLYDTHPGAFGDTVFVDVMAPPPWRGRPRNVLSFDEVVAGIVSIYDKRNWPEFEWEGVVPRGASAEDAALPDEGNDDEVD